MTLSQVKASCTQSRAVRRCHTVRACSEEHAVGRRGVLALLPALTLAAPAQADVAADASFEPFLKHTGARGFLAEEEEMLFNLRAQKEAEVREELRKERELFEQEARKSQQGLCATPFGVDVVGITEFVLLIGALVGGVAARQRKKETERLNEQLRKINMQLRQQARAGTIYAPGLSYAPTGTASVPSTASLDGGNAATATVETATAARVATMPPASLNSLDEPESPEQARCREVLREGKRFLRSDQGAAALVRFEKALLMSRKINDLVLQRRALRGMAASARMQGNNLIAIRHLESVLDLSKQMIEFTGDADAYGSIADIYTEMGEFEKAASYYDKYITRMQEDEQGY